MNKKKNKGERSAQMQEVSAGLQDVLGMNQWREAHPKATLREIDALLANQRRRGDQAGTQLRDLPRVWARDFSPWMSN